MKRQEKDVREFLLEYLKKRIGPLGLSVIGETEGAVLFHAAVYRLYPPCWYIGRDV
jgi:hypothetical protein